VPLTNFLDSLAQGDVTSGLVIFFALMIAHALCDHPLQGDFLALNKSRHFKPEGGSGTMIWPYCLTVHALIHAGGVWVVTGRPLLALIEFVLHWIIDALKAEGVTNIHVDQLLHVLCKVGYVLALAYGFK
jgi:hypothetical protein